MPPPTSHPADHPAVVRLARPSDLRHLAAVEESGGALFVEHLGPGLNAVLLGPAPSGASRDADGVLLVAALGAAAGGEVVGFAHLVVLDGEAHLEQLSVRPEHGRRGLGARLVRAVMEEARWAGHDRLSLTTYRDLPWNGPFYRRLGFTEVDPIDLEPYQRRLRAREQALGLDDDGVRVVMSAPLRRPAVS